MKLKTSINLKTNKITFDFSEIELNKKRIYGHLAKVLMDKDNYSKTDAKKAFIAKGLKNENLALKPYADLGIMYEPLIIENLLNLYPQLQRVNDTDGWQFEEKAKINEMSLNDIILGRMIDLETIDAIFEIKTVTSNCNNFYEKAFNKLDDYVSQLAWYKYITFEKYKQDKKCFIIIQRGEMKNGKNGSEPKKPTSMKHKVFSSISEFKNWEPDNTIEQFIIQVEENLLKINLESIISKYQALNEKQIFEESLIAKENKNAINQIKLINKKFGVDIPLSLHVQKWNSELLEMLYLKETNYEIKLEVVNE